MPKNRLDDMIKIKVIKKDSFSNRLEKAERNSILEKLDKKPPLDLNKYKKVNKTSPKYLLWVVALFSVVFLFFGLSYLFSRADVSITPKIQDVKVDTTLSAVKDTNSSLPFDLVVISGEENTKVASSEQKEIEVKAKGTAILYNNFSKNSQLLSIDTRLEGSNGKLYKTDKKIVIPGIDKDGKPGKVEVGIYASSGGEEYNTKPIDFKIFGFKNTPKYSKIYGRAKGDIVGGLKGDFYTISASEKEKVVSSLRINLETKLLKKATEQIPAGFLLFKDAVFLNVSGEALDAVSKEKSVPVSLKGTLYGFLFEEKKLTKRIVGDILEKYDGAPVYLYNLKDLQFSLLNKESISFGEVKNISFTLKGDSKIVWEFDVDKFVIDLLGKSKKDFNLTLSKYANITSASSILKPFWRRSFPDAPKDIKIIVNYPK